MLDSRSRVVERKPDVSAPPRSAQEGLLVIGIDHSDGRGDQSPGRQRLMTSCSLSS